MTPELFTYQSDDPANTHGDPKFATLVAGTGGGDYLMFIEDENGIRSRGIRVRTSGSSDPRNFAVCMAIQQLVRALRGDGEPE